jgi:hypothetical protein
VRIATADATLSVSILVIEIDDRAWSRQAAWRPLRRDADSVGCALFGVAKQGFRDFGYAGNPCDAHFVVEGHLEHQP